MTIYKIDNIQNDIGNVKIQTGYMTNVTKKNITEYKYNKKIKMQIRQNTNETN